MGESFANKHMIFLVLKPKSQRHIKTNLKMQTKSWPEINIFQWFSGAHAGLESRRLLRFSNRVLGIVAFPSVWNQYWQIAPRNWKATWSKTLLFQWVLLQNLFQSLLINERASAQMHWFSARSGAKI